MAKIGTATSSNVEILGTIYERFLGKTVRPHGRGVVIDPGVKVLRHHDHVEACFFGKAGVLDEDLGLPLLMATEVGEAGHGMLLVWWCWQPRWGHGPTKSRNATLLGHRRS